MTVTAKILKTKKNTKTTRIEATREIMNDKVAMAKIVRSYSEAKSGRTVSLRDFMK